MISIDTQKRRLLRRLQDGPAMVERGATARWLGRRAGEVIQELEEAGVIISLKAGRKTYLVAVWRWHEI